MQPKENTTNWKVFLQLIKDTNPPKIMMTIAVMMSILATAAGLAIPLFTKNLVDNFSMASLNPTTIAILVVVFLAQAISGGLSIYLLNYIGQHVVARLRDRLWNKFLKLPIPFYDTTRTGEMVSRMTNDTAVLKGLITDHLTNFFTGIISIIGSIVILLILDWQMTIIMLIAAPLTLAILIPLGRKMHRVSRGLQDETAKFTALIQQVLSEIRLVKASNAEKVEKTDGERGIHQLFTYGVREGKISAFISPLVSLVMMGLLVVIIGYGGMRVASGALTAGDLVAFILYMFQIIVPMAQFTAFFTQLQKAKGATERIIVTLGEREETHDHGEMLTDIQAPIVFNHVSFAYEADDFVLTNIQLTADLGKVTAIVGPSGSGKTTLFSLLERFYIPTDGKIKLGERPIQNFTLKSWREQIGYVAQESPLIAGTVRENITYGFSDKFSQAEIEKAAKMAYADQFIRELADGYDTEVGERGIKLSGGQRQRIGIARALLRDPKILLLDEATSSLDAKSEIAVQKALNNLMHGRTTLVIAHRLSTVMDADKIIFLDDGKITGSGTHEELVKSHKMYQEFTKQQLRFHQPTV